MARPRSGLLRLIACCGVPLLNTNVCTGFCAGALNSDTPTLMKRCRRDRQPDEGRRELVRLVQHRSAVAIRAEPGLETVGEIRRHIVEEPPAAFFGCGPSRRQSGAGPLSCANRRTSGHEKKACVFGTPRSHGRPPSSAGDPAHDPAIAPGACARGSAGGRRASYVRRAPANSTSSRWRAGRDRRAAGSSGSTRSRGAGWARGPSRPSTCV